MIQLKNSEQLKEMREAGRITGEALLVARDNIREGMSTYELDRIIHDYILSQGAKPSFLGYGGFPASACLSVNDEVIHGIPSKHVILQDGDIVKIDVGAYKNGFHGDAARTVVVGRASEKAEKLIKVTRDSFFAGVEKFVAGNRLGDIGNAIDSLVVENGFSTVKRYIGHGIGKALHESPDVPNYGTPGRGARLCTGMVLAIEPMVNAGGEAVKEMPDGWTVKTADGSLSAHYENTVALTANGIEILTLIQSDF